MATTAADRVFLDTSVLVAAEVGAHPSHTVAAALVDRLVERGAALCISPQVCREFLCVVTRGVVEGRRFTNGEALEALAATLGGCTLLEEGEEVLLELLDLVERCGVRGKQVHDANIVATMLASRVGRLATLDQGDFRRYEDAIALEPVTT